MSIKRNILSFKDFKKGKDSLENPKEHIIKESANETIEPLTWSEYCQNVFDATASEVEKAIKKDFDKEEIAGFKKATYYVLGGVTSPDINKGAVKTMLSNAKKQIKELGPDVIMLNSEYFFDKPGSMRQNAVACTGDGLAPYSIEFD